MGNFRIGWSEVNITPEKKVSLVGQFAERISEYVEKPLTATAMAVSTDEEQLVMCSCDLVSVSHTLLEVVREKLQNNGAGLDPMKVVLSAIHTHTGPGYAGRGNSSAKQPAGASTSFRGLLESELPPDKKYIESANVSQNPDIATDDELLVFLSDRIAQCVLEAWNQPRAGRLQQRLWPRGGGHVPARLLFGRHRADVGRHGYGGVHPPGGRQRFGHRTAVRIRRQART